jgi:hypothetical protein
VSLQPTSSKRRRAYNILVGAFFLAMIWAMLVAGVVAEGDWTIGKIAFRNANFSVLTLFGLIGAVVYYRGAKQP